MRILHATCHHSTFSQGGTEVYIDALSRALSRFGIEQKYLLLCYVEKQKIDDDMWELDGMVERDMNQMRCSFQKNILKWHPDCILLHTNNEHQSWIVQLAIEENIPIYLFVHVQWSLGCLDRERLTEKRPICLRPLTVSRCLYCYCRRYFGENVIKNTWEWCQRMTMEGFRRLGLTSKSRWHEIDARCDEVKRVLKGVTGCIVFSEKQREHLLKCGFDEEKILVMPQGVTEEEYAVFSQNKKQRRDGIAKLGYVGRMTEDKGVDIFLRAIALLSKNIMYEMHVYGMPLKDDAYSSMLRNICQDCSQVVFHIMMSHEELIREYGKLDVVVIPSLGFETGPYTLLEGVYSGCRIVASANIGQQSLVEKYGTIVSPNTPEKWASMLQDTVCNIGEIRQRNVVIEDRDIRLMTSCVVHLLDFINIKKRRPSLANSVEKSV